MNKRVFIKKLILKALSLDTDMIVIKPEGPEIHLFSNKNSATPRRIDHTFENVHLQFHDILDYLRAYSFSYNEIKGALSRNILDEKNILLKLSGNLILGSITKGASLTQNETSIQINFSKIKEENIHELFSISNKLVEIEKDYQHKDKGVILYNGSEKAGTVLLHAILPKSTHIEVTQLEDYFSNNQELFNEPLLLSHQFDDAADGILTFLEKAKNIGAFDQALNSLDYSIILKALRKQCGICAKPTAIPPDAKDKFPAAFRKLIPDSYQFSRGCSECGYSSYRGVTFIESILPITPEAKTSLGLSLDPTIIYKEQAKHRGSGIFENSISQIQAGVISVEEVLKVLPIISNAHDAYFNHNPYNESSNTVNTSNNKPSILIVEDDENQREVLKLVFIKEGYDVITAQNGKDALNKISETQVQVILSDLMMPEMNGMEFLKCCKADQRLAKIPVLMLTASSNPDHELTLLDQGAADYCPKNVKKKVLLKRVEKLLEKKVSNIESPLAHLLSE